MAKVRCKRVQRETYAEQFMPDRNNPEKNLPESVVFSGRCLNYNRPYWHLMDENGIASTIHLGNWIVYFPEDSTKLVVTDDWFRLHYEIID